MPDDESNVSALRGAVPRTKREVQRAGQTRFQQALATVFVALIAAAALGALVRLNIWLWAGR